MHLKTKNIIFALGATVMLTALAADLTKPTGVIHLDHETVAAAFAKGAPLLATNNFKVQAGRRTEPGEVEVHDSDTDIFYILEGTATFVTGGNVVDARATGPGETRGREIDGGASRRLQKGDIIVIPNHTPHWFKQVEGPFLYYVVKVSQEPNRK